MELALYYSVVCNVCVCADVEYNNLIRTCASRQCAPQGLNYTLNLFLWCRMCRMMIEAGGSRDAKNARHMRCTGDKSPVVRQCVHCEAKNGSVVHQQLLQKYQKEGGRG